jgi:dipeptidyl aminopeptidase/acylaminoacyl peptidase
MKGLIFFCFFLISIIATAQQKQVLTAKDYENAERFLSYNTSPLVDNGPVNPNWLPGDLFWFKNLNSKGSEFILVNPAKKSVAPAFDHLKLASGINAATGKSFTESNLPFQSFSFVDNNAAITFKVEEKLWKCDLKTYLVTADTTKKVAPGPNRIGRRIRPDAEVVSPDGSKAAFIRKYNLWVKDVKTGTLTQLTTDGIKDFGYATDNAGWKSSDAPILSWSPDSKKIATFKQDQRNASNMYLVSTNVGEPKLKEWKYPLPGDKEIITIQRVIINVETPKVITLQIPPDPHRATLSDDIASSGTFDDVNWSADGTKLAFVSTSRDHKQEKFRIADTKTGAVSDIFQETVATQYESGQGTINWTYLDKTNEIIWYSERDNWGHLYLYDATTGKLKNQITTGNWVVTSLVMVDEKKRELYFIADGNEPENPYFSQLYKIGFDGRHLTLLTPEKGNHNISISPSKKYFVDNYSQPDVPTISVLRDLNGKLITNIQKTDITRLQAAGWKGTTPFSVKAHDGKTDIYGLLFTPTNLDPTKKYPVIDYIYPGPQGGSVGSWSFSASRGDNQALAELGFIVIAVEGTSNPLRSKSYHDMSYGNMAENTLPDQIAAIRQLSQKYAYIDTNKVGIWGHSGGGFATAAAMFRYPDFFKVGISESGNHDNRNYEDDWGERYNGLVANSNYEAQANQVYAKNLKGKLLLAHGLMDDNVPPQNTFLVIDALEKANKDYDLIVFPNSAHGYGSFSYYMMRRRWDYFVKNLLNAEAPKEYALSPKADPRN